MFLLKSQINAVYGRPHLTFCVLKGTIQSLGSNTHLRNETFRRPKDENNLEILFKKFQDKILFNSTIETECKKMGYKRYKAQLCKIERENNKIEKSVSRIQPLPVSLKYILDDINSKSISKQPTHTDKKEESSNNMEEKPIQFPYNTSDSCFINEEQKSCNEEVNESFSVESEIDKRSQLLASTENWMSGYDNFENDLEHEVVSDYWKINYGTEDSRSKISNVPCGGCGAFLHCKDSAIPGYIPSEIFKNCGKKGAADLKSIVCQRCYFLKEYNLALQVRVSPDDYPKLLTTIQNKKALVILMVDLLDFPCSIWPGIADILGRNKPIVIVGNKIDLLPIDGSKFLHHIKENLLQQIKLAGFATSNILHLSIISAKTGFGVEDLITSLQTVKKHKGIGGDVYIVGCTNVGKSSLFNALLQSDYCKIQVSDLIQRATTSQWPGTTLNLLKFPITRLAGYRLILRHQRLDTAGRIAKLEKKLKKDQLRKTNNPKYASLVGHIGQTFTMEKYTIEEGDNFSVKGRPNESGKLELGINENHPDLALSRWCYDTPGVIQPDQILNLLTVEELMATLPKEIITPKTFCVKPGTSVFIAGLARLDYLGGPNSIRLTVFRSGELPITICHLEDAEYVYNECLGTEMFKVPSNIGDRLSKWPGLEPSKPFSVTGTDYKISCNDVVLSSAGWIAINCTPNKEYKFQAWTPEKRGVYVRNCLLPKAVTLRGARVKFSVAYKTHKLVK